MQVGSRVKFNGTNLRSANWGEKVSGEGILEEIFDYGPHKIANIRVKDRNYDNRFIFGKLLEDKDLVALNIVEVDDGIS